MNSGRFFERTTRDADFR